MLEVASSFPTRLNLLRTGRAGTRTGPVPWRGTGRGRVPDVAGQGAATGAACSQKSSGHNQKVPSSGHNHNDKVQSTECSRS